MKKKYKIIGAMTVFMMVFGCTEQPQLGNELVNSEVSTDAISEAIFGNEKLDTIVNSYISHLKNQEETAIHNQLVMLSFSEESGDGNLWISTSRFPASFLDEQYSWLYKTSFRGCDILISDRIQNPIGSKFYLPSKIEKYVEDTLIPPPFTDYIFDESYWHYKVENEDLILIDKTNGG